jgi:hypothetical protein
MQNHHLVAYLSKALGPRNQALSVDEKECLAILLAIEKWAILAAPAICD